MLIFVLILVILLFAYEIRRPFSGRHLEEKFGNSFGNKQISLEQRDEIDKEVVYRFGPQEQDIFKLPGAYAPQAKSQAGQGSSDYVAMFRGPMVHNGWNY